MCVSDIPLQIQGQVLDIFYAGQKKTLKITPAVFSPQQYALAELQELIRLWEVLFVKQQI